MLVGFGTVRIMIVVNLMVVVVRRRTTAGARGSTIARVARGRGRWASPDDHFADSVGEGVTAIHTRETVQHGDVVVQGLTHVHPDTRHHNASMRSSDDCKSEPLLISGDRHVDNVAIVDQRAEARESLRDHCRAAAER